MMRRDLDAVGVALGVLWWLLLAMKGHRLGQWWGWWT